MGQKEVTPWDRSLRATRATPEPTSSVALEKSTPNPPVVTENKGVAQCSELLPWVPWPKPGRTVDLHIDKARRQDAASAVPLLISYTPLLKKQLLWVQDSAPAHPQILPEDRAVGTWITTRPWNQPLVLTRTQLVPAPTILLGPALHIPGSPTQLCLSRGLCSTLAPSLHPTQAYHQFYTQPNHAPCSPDLSSAPPRRMRQLVNWSTGAHAAHCPLRIVSRAEPRKLWAQAGSGWSSGNRKPCLAEPRDSA